MLCPKENKYPPLQGGVSIRYKQFWWNSWESYFRRVSPRNFDVALAGNKVSPTIIIFHLTRGLRLPPPSAYCALLFFAVLYCVVPCCPVLHRRVLYWISIDESGSITSERRNEAASIYLAHMGRSAWASDSHSTSPSSSHIILCGNAVVLGFLPRTRFIIQPMHFQTHQTRFCEMNEQFSLCWRRQPILSEITCFTTCSRLHFQQPS